jgi:signal transduction histidine kinase
MDNGCKFSPDKKVKSSLSFSPEGGIVIEFADNGPGIPQEELPMIFNAFYRSPRTSTVKGSGIGLSLVQSILKLHHIELSVNSRSGQGTTFILNFPVVSMDETINE